MKINFDIIDTTRFDVKENLVAGYTCFLVVPKKSKEGLGIKWNEENKVFRSSIWDIEGNLVSPSFKKFVNLGEQPDFEPININDSFQYVEKLDGSLLIISSYKNELVARTRGTFDARNLANGWEIDTILKPKYPKLFEFVLHWPNITLLCEWRTPTNFIVERDVDEPTLTLIGAISHLDYSYWKNSELDELAIQLEIGRPKIHTFDTLADAAASVKNWQKGEGLVIYSECGQILKKTKAERYLALHRITTNLNSEKSVVELWNSVGQPKTGNEFLELVEFEVRPSVDPYVQTIMDATVDFIEKLKWVRQNLKYVPDTRKDQALWIQTLTKVKQKIGFAIISGKDDFPVIDNLCFEYVLEQVKKFVLDRKEKEANLAAQADGN